MSYKLDQNIDLSPRTNATYFASSVHRNRQPNKSQWVISVVQEVECFIESQINNWIEGIFSWGMISDGNNLIVLGKSVYNEELKLAKFVTKNDDGVWHGYPADFCKNFQDRPGIKILQKWRNCGHIEKHHITKIRQGKTCSL
ncbi:MAG: hypothetical protein LBI42_09370 [Chitinispirillales bacterium]|jgi:hypothetical protein|nr:hypothetical protein [Chitinispirillales bacterium]